MIRSVKVIIEFAKECPLWKLFHSFTTHFLYNCLASNNFVDFPSQMTDQQALRERALLCELKNKYCTRAWLGKSADRSQNSILLSLLGHCDIPVFYAIFTSQIKLLLIIKANQTNSFSTLRWTYLHTFVNLIHYSVPFFAVIWSSESWKDGTFWFKYSQTETQWSSDPTTTWNSTRSISYMKVHNSFTYNTIIKLYRKHV